jgi:hypothetical protein
MFVAVAAVVAGLIAADRGLAVLVARLVAWRVAAVSDKGAPPHRPVKVKIAGAPFVTQLIVGRYRSVEFTVATFTGAGLDFADLTARLTRVLAPLGRLLTSGGVIAGEVTATATVPFRALAQRLPPGLTIRPHGDDLRIVGSILRMPVSGTLGIKAEPRQIALTPKVVGVPALVGFVIALPAMPPQLTIASVRVTTSGLEVSVRGRDVRLLNHRG